MRGKLTVSEVAKLLGVSAHTIRYYHKEGLISSDTDIDSGYRLFDFEDIYRLSNVILLRDSGISIKDIKDLIRDYSIDGYKSKLNKSLKNIEDQIDRLKIQRDIIRRNISVLNLSEGNITVTKYPDRYLKFVNREMYSNPNTPKGFFDAMHRQNIDSILYKDVIYELLDDKMILYYEDCESPDFHLAKGSYLEFYVKLRDDVEIIKVINRMIEYSMKQGLVLDNHLFINISPNALLVAEEGYTAVLFARIIK